MSIKSICIYGAGALGGAIAVKLASQAGNDATISVVARGAHLDAIRDNGLSLREAGAERPLNVRLTATDDPRTLPPQDLVITGLKGHQLAPAAEGAAAGTGCGGAMPTLADLFTTCYLTGGSGVEFSAIRLHCRGVDEICRAFGAAALTVGSDIYFRQEAFAPNTPEGLRLLAHEVAHVVQQRRGAVAAPQAAGGLAVAPAGSAEEREADAAADALLCGRRFDFGAAGFPAANCDWKQTKSLTLSTGAMLELSQLAKASPHSQVSAMNCEPL